MPQRRARTPQCAYQEGPRRCRRNGTGNPPLCHAHRVLLEQAPAHPPAFGRGLKDLIDHLRDGRRIPTDTIFGALGDILHGMRGPSPAPSMPHVGRAADPGTYRRPAAPPPPPPPGPPKATDPRWSVLGFQKADEPLTVEAVKRRRQELARRHHPDRGGNLKTMQRVNEAADLLLSEIDAG